LDFRLNYLLGRKYAGKMAEIATVSTVFRDNLSSYKNNTPRENFISVGTVSLWAVNILVNSCHY